MRGLAWFCSFALIPSKAKHFLGIAGVYSKESPNASAEDALSELALASECLALGTRHGGSRDRRITGFRCGQSWMLCMEQVFQSGDAVQGCC